MSAANPLSPTDRAALKEAARKAKDAEARLSRTGSDADVREVQRLRAALRTLCTPEAILSLLEDGERLESLDSFCERVGSILYDGDAPDINEIEAATLANPGNTARCYAAILAAYHDYRDAHGYPIDAARSGGSE